LKYPNEVALALRQKKPSKIKILEKKQHFSTEKEPVGFSQHGS
jgi:hypothetical protein